MGRNDDAVLGHEEKAMPTVGGLRRNEGGLVSWYDEPVRFVFFTGKGGVGKTSLACATAVRLAGTGARVLLVSTDPASNLGQVFGQTIGKDAATPVTGVTGLLARNLDPEAAARAYRERLVGTVRGVLPDESVRSIEEQLSGACTTEIAAFDELTALLTGGEGTTAFDHIVFDTAPTGHTLRLLSLAGAWSAYLDAGTGDASCLGPLAGLEKQREQYAAAFGGGAPPPAPPGTGASARPSLPRRCASSRIRPIP